MNIFLQYTPYTLSPEVAPSWHAIKESYADRVMDMIEEYAPGFQSRVLHRHVVSPLDLEEEYGMTGGNIFHGEMSVDQLFFLRPAPGWAKYRTPIRGLYLCGSGAHPGGGVMGAPGHNAAREIQKDWKKLKRG
jgi:phytoene dehydrogenase-like protein